MQNQQGLSYQAPAPQAAKVPANSAGAPCASDVDHPYPELAKYQLVGSDEGEE